LAGAAGQGGYDSEGPSRFVHTVLVEMRERLRRSKRPDRVFEVTLSTAAAAKVLGRRRVLDPPRCRTRWRPWTR
jgi:hypothetical protein